MDESQVACLDTNLQDLDEVVLSDRALGTDSSKILVESSDPHKLRLRLIEWLAEAPNRRVKSERKEAIAQFKSNLASGGLQPLETDCWCQRNQLKQTDE